MHEELYNIKELVLKEVNHTVEVGCVKPNEWENLGEAIDILKDIATIESMEGFDNSSSTYSTNYPHYKMPVRNSYTGDKMDSRGSRDPYMDDVHYSTDANADHTIRMLEEKLNRTSDPAMRDHLMQTINMMKFER